MRICSLLFAFLFYFGLNPQMQVEPWFANLPQVTKQAEVNFDYAAEQGSSFRHLQKYSSKGMSPASVPSVYIWHIPGLSEFTLFGGSSSLKTLHNHKLPRCRAPPVSFA
ncbi:MAG: hypothetical protein ACM3MG_08740 [Bacillota bacterium]